MPAVSGSEEISIQDIIGRVKDWRIFILSNWIKLILVGIVGGALGFLYAALAKPKYTGSVSFVLSTGDNGKMGGLGGLAGQFGVDIMTGGGNDAFSGDNITTLMTSRQMIKKALFKAPAESKENLLNLIVAELDLNKAWQKNPRTAGLYPFPKQASDLNAVQDSLFREVHSLIISKKVITVDKPNKKQSIFIANSVFSNELISAYFPRYLVNETAQFYINTKTKVAQQNLSMLKHEADSLHKLLSGVVASTASSVDRTFNLNSAYQLQRVGVQEGQLKITAVSAAYSEVLKNLEIAKITLQKETPLFQIIDEPVLPLKKEKVGKVSTAIIWGLVLGIMGLMYYTSLFIFRKYTANSNS